MKRHDFSQWDCSLARTVDIIGDWWTPLILRDAARGVTTFDDFHLSLGISRNTLTQRLNRLVDHGMLQKTLYSERPKRYRYVMTEQGVDFVPVLMAMAAWGDKWIADAAPPFRVRHKTCGAEATARVVCACCNEPLALSDLEPLVEKA